MADHLSRLTQEQMECTKSDLPIDDSFPDDHLFRITEELLQLSTSNAPWYADFVNYLVCNELLVGLSFQQRKKFMVDVRHYYWNEPFLFKRCADGVYRRYIPEDEVESFIHHCHSLPCGGHASSSKTTTKILQSRMFTRISLLVTHANVPVIFLEETKCLSTTSRKLRFLMFGESTS